MQDKKKLPLTPKDVEYIRKTVSKVERIRKAQAVLSSDKNIPTIFIRDDGFHSDPPEKVKKA
jgi:hypothetical protein